MTKGRVMHYLVDDKIACRSAGYTHQGTYMPSKVTCKRCQDSDDFKEMVNDQRL